MTIKEANLISDLIRVRIIQAFQEVGAQAGSYIDVHDEYSARDKATKIIEELAETDSKPYI